MRNNIYVLLFILSLLQVKAQLLPSIGLNTIPANSASICAEPFYSGNFYSSGYQQGAAVPDFKLYSLNGDSLVLSQALAGGKPVLLIAGSLTCPVFRAKVATINQVVATYSSNIRIYIIYTLEAHPTDTSVYFGYINVTSQNISAGILFPQPQTYADRKNMADTMNTLFNLTAPVFIDGPCNTWWKNFGPAPNNSYLIGTNGVVLTKHGWFHKSPDNIFCDLDSILNLNSGLCIPPPTIPGSFTLNVLNSSVTGAPNDLLYDYVDLINTTSVTTTIKVKKLIKSLPPVWQTAFCADICYGFNDDSVEVSIDAYDTLHFSLDFFTASIPDSGSVKVGFKNVNKSNNSFSIWLKASTIVNDVSIQNYNKRALPFNVYPNPATNRFFIETSESEFSLIVYDVVGRQKYLSQNEKTIDTSQWHNGIYFLVLKTSDGTFCGKVLLLK
ncbi:MAG: T9SS type A sorting domain-containing protein [Bacteroidota bacterium]